MYYIGTRIEYVSITSAHKFSVTYFKRNTLLNWSRLGENRYGANQYSQSICNLKVLFVY